MSSSDMRTPNVRFINISSQSFVEKLVELQTKYFNQADHERVGRFLREADRRRATGSIVLQKELIRELAKIDSFIDIVIEYSKYGKPMFGELVYNVSHDRDLVAIAWLRPSESVGSLIGIDIMCRRTLNVATYNECFSDTERVSIATDQDMFLDFWCAKEALSKAVGLGLGIDFRTIQYSPNKRSIRYRDCDYPVDQFEHIDGTERYVVAIVVVDVAKDVKVGEGS